MRRIEFRKSNRRRFAVPVVDLLEGRQLLNASSVAKPEAQLLHAEVMKSSAEATELAKQEKAEAAKIIKQEQAANAKLAKQQKAEATKLAKQEKAAAAKLAKQEKAANALPPAIKVVHTASTTKVVNKLISIEGTGDDGTATQNTTPIAGSLTPIQLQTAYGINGFVAGGNNGAGETIAIVEEGTDTGILTDANAYSSYYGLPLFGSAGGPTMTIVNDTDLGTVGTAKTYGSGGEYALDVEMVHAMAPKANLLLVNVPATGTNANAITQLSEGVQFAAKMAGTLSTPLVGVTLSYGLTEAQIGNASVVSQDATYFATGASYSLPITVSTGDNSTPGFPGTSPEVIAVGGTSLYLASARGKYSYETAWGGLAGAGAGGGGASTNLAAPAYQTANGVTLSTKRTIPDISMVADVVTAVSVYDSYDGGSSPWTAYGGTSVAAPLTQGVIALVQQDRIAAGQPILNSVEVDTALYEGYTNPTTYASILHDVTLGSNKNVSSAGRTTVTGYSAATGYDLATGLGSPNGAGFVPYLINYKIGT